MGASTVADPKGGVTWSVHVTDVATGEVLLDQNGGAVLPCASIGKILVLIEAARRFEAGTLDPAALLERTREDAVGDSGIWQDLRTSALPATDACALIGAVSDNLATNVVLRALSLEAVATTARELKLGNVTLHDRVRDQRAPDMAPHLATASARSLAQLFARLHRDELASPQVSLTVRTWLAANTDLSMVASAWGLDPLAHRAGDAPLVGLANKTGTDLGVRADAGTVSSPHRTIAYAVLAHWRSSETSRDEGTLSYAPSLARMREIGRDAGAARHGAVLARMREIGGEILEDLHGTPVPSSTRRRGSTPTLRGVAP